MDNSSLIKESVTKPVKMGISGSTLKLIAIVIMLIDHIGATIIEKMLFKRGMAVIDWNNAKEADKFIADNYVLSTIDGIMRTIGRLAFPIFCFLLIEGIIHTHNKWKYASRLAAFALISEIPFDLAFNNKPFDFTYQNVFFTLLIGLLVMIGFEMINDIVKDKKFLPVVSVVGAILTGRVTMPFIFNLIRKLKFVNKNGVALFNFNQTGSILLAVFIIIVSLLVYGIMIKKTSIQTANMRFTKLGVLITGMVLADFLMTDYSGFGVLTIAIMYALRKSRFKAMLAGCTTLTIMQFSEFSSFFNLFLINRYNGERGWKLKYLFYLFYPVHLFLLYLICYFMKIV